MFRLSLFFALFLGSLFPAFAGNFCIKALKNGKPKLPVEVKSPYRMASDPLVVGGKMGLLVKAYNRHEIYEIVDNDYRLVREDFPHVWGLSYPYRTFPLRAGGAIGIGSKPRAIYYLPADGERFERIEGTQDYVAASFDAVSQILFFQPKNSNRISVIWAGKVLPTTLPTLLERGVGDIHFIPELEGYLAKTSANFESKKGNRFWFLKDKDGVWLPASEEFEKEDARVLDYYLRDKTILVEEDVRILKIFTNNRPTAFFRIEDGRPVFDKAISEDGWTQHEKSRSALLWNPMFSERKKTWWGKVIEPETPKLYILRYGQTVPEEIPNIAPAKIDDGNGFLSFSTFIDALPETGDLLIETDKGRVLFDGKDFAAVPGLGYDILGRHVRFVHSGLKKLLQSEKGVFVMNDDLLIKQVTQFPFHDPWRHNVSIEYFPKLEAYLINDRRTGDVYSSAAFETFHRIEGSAEITQFVAALPDRAAVLAVAKDGLVTIEKDCR
ncbi:hypothetical protein [Cohaesibacter gelatinilyticus]|uniref:WG containing repeat-containing protein n=1 Tax=Cohaesibacter gelatinilyticus TaxID=372072 RepID=A0A285PDH2_9HYPH|nr:hypothetical protein [Cohaesibacter gelatinilyticus]SNZ19273.1 hypothetical protein SAMN06265368_2353 [Cohaesibacter gelatinilyticus]